MSKVTGYLRDTMYYSLLHGTGVPQTERGKGKRERPLPLPASILLAAIGGEWWQMAASARSFSNAPKTAPYRPE
jgi:hypothetical protein